MNLWKNYKKTLDDIFPDFKFKDRWCNWCNKNDLNMTADLYTAPHFIKSRQVDIRSDKTDIYNNVMYPKTGSNLPCFGMDLMGFHQKKVIIVFDFQHPVENYVLNVPPLPKADKTYRFFEMGNHFSENIFVRYCNMDSVDTYLPTFRYYLTLYKEMIDQAQPTGEDTTQYKDFDAYMKRLDPILGYLSGNFGKENANRMMDEYFFPYAQ